MNASCTHLANRAADIEASISFYRRYAGLVEVHRREDGSIPVVWLAEPERGTEGLVIVLLGTSHAAAANPAPMAHIGYAVDARSAVDRIAAGAAGEGILVEQAQDAGPIVGYFCIVRDPDGNLVEFSHGQSLGPSAS